MYLNDYDPGLGSLKKKLKKLGKVAAHVGAAVATGGASLAVSAAMINAKKQKQAQAAAAAQEAAMIAQITAPPPIAPVAVTPPSVKTGGDIATAVVPSGPMPSFTTTEAPPAPSQPAWMMPAMLVGGGLLLATLLNRPRSQ